MTIPALGSPYLGMRHCRAFLDQLSSGGVAAPAALTDIAAAAGRLGAIQAGGDAIAQLVEDVAGGKLAGQELDDAITAAANARQVSVFKSELVVMFDRRAARLFAHALNDGAADEIIDSLRPAFNGSATALVTALALVPPGVDAESFLASATSEQLAAWKSIDEHVAKLTAIGSLVAQFGCKSTDFSLIAPPSRAGGWFCTQLSDLALLCTGPDVELTNASALFNTTGRHRNSPWFRAAPFLSLCTIAEAREKLREAAEGEWEATSPSPNARGVITPEGWKATPIQNPYAKSESVPA
ncbi:hypothetical protein [Mycobacterium sp. NPDC050853]|uniref:hypothetical protein n=1 Tax=Mycobacterium sp. NPDC050853 TaxID=3155160 RepID=UPI0033F002A8